MKNGLETREGTSTVSNILPSAVAMTILSVLSSCDNDATITKLNFNEKGKDYKIEVSDGEVSVHFAMNEDKGKYIDYSIFSSKDSQTGKIRVYINGKTEYEGITNAEIDKNFVYDNEQEFQEKFLSDASSAINQGFAELIGAMFPDGIEGLEGGNDRVKGKMEHFNTLKRRANKLFLYNQSNNADAIVVKQGNSIKTTIGDNEVELINSDMSVKGKNGKGAIYNLLINNEKVDYIVLSEDFDQCYATIRDRLLADNQDAVGYEEEAKLTGIRLAATNK